MKISIQVKSGLRVDKFIKISEGSYLVYTKSRAIKDEANKAIIELISQHFNVSKDSIIIKSGIKSKFKIIEIL